MWIESYHGTSDTAASAILASSFNESAKEIEWLGHGVYFFVDGISDPLANAREWAQAQAVGKSGYKYDRYAVVKCEVELQENRVINLTETAGLKAFDTIKRRFEDEIDSLFDVDPLPSKGTHACMLFNFIVKRINACAVKHNLYIKFHKERTLKMHFQVPNTTVLCVPKEHFVAQNLHIADTGEVK